MKLTEDDARRRLVAHDHGVLCTVHAERGVDAVPVVYAVVDDVVGVPIDRVKPKSSSRLQRQINLEADPRASLLIELWDRDDWSKLWWVRAELRYEGDGASPHEDALGARLSEGFVQYRERPFTDMLVLRVSSVSGWQARPT